MKSYILGVFRAKFQNNERDSTIYWEDHIFARIWQFVDGISISRPLEKVWPNLPGAWSRTWSDFKYASLHLLCVASQRSSLARASCHAHTHFTPNFSSKNNLFFNTTAISTLNNKVLIWLNSPHFAASSHISTLLCIVALGIWWLVILKV